MFGVNSLKNNPNETPHGSTRDDSEANNEVFYIPGNPESTVKKRKIDKGRVKCPRLSSFNMSALRLSSSNSESSKGANESSFFTTDEEIDELRCSPMIQTESPVFLRKKISSYSLTPHKNVNKESKPYGSTTSDNDGVQEPLCLSDSINDAINDSIKSPNEALEDHNIFMQDPEQMKMEKVGTPHGLICPPAQCPQRPSKIRRSECSVGGERSCRLLFTKSEDAMKDKITSYGCDAGFCVSQTSEKPTTPAEFGIDFKNGCLNFDVQASGSKTIDPETPADLIIEKNVGGAKSTAQNELVDKLQETLNPNIQHFGIGIIKNVTSAKTEVDPIIHVNNENDLNRFIKLHNDSNTPVMAERIKVAPESQHIDNIDKLDKLSSPKSANVFNNEILKNDAKNAIGFSTPILKIDVDYSQSLATPTHDQNPSKSGWVSIPCVAPTLNADKYLGNFTSSVKVLLTPTDSPINSSSCSCSCTECDFSPPSAARAKTISQTIDSNDDNDMESETQMPNIIDVVIDPIIVENESQIQEKFEPQMQENIVESSSKSAINIIARNESLTSTPKDLTPLSVRSNVTAISGVSPLPSSTPRPRHKHKHDHHHHHHNHHKHHQSMHHLTVHSNSHHHVTSDGDILITSTPMNRQYSAEELVKEEISSVGSDIDSVNSDFCGKRSRFVMSDLCGSDQSGNHYSLSNNMLIGDPTISYESKKLPTVGGAMYITGKIGSGSREVMDDMESANNSEDQCKLHLGTDASPKLHLGTDASPEVWMMDESVLLPRRASSVDETLFRVISQESPICLSLN